MEKAIFLILKIIFKGLFKLILLFFILCKKLFLFLKNKIKQNDLQNKLVKGVLFGIYDENKIDSDKIDEKTKKIRNLKNKLIDKSSNFLKKNENKNNIILNFFKLGLDEMKKDFSKLINRLNKENKQDKEELKKIFKNF